MTSRKERIYIVYHGRFPSERAAALFVAKEAESFVDSGVETVLLVPCRIGRSKKPYSDFYGIPRTFKVVFLPVIDLFPLRILESPAFLVSFFSFSFSTLVYLLFRAHKEDVIYSNESLPLLFASFFFPKTVYEMHDFPKAKKGMYQKLFSRAWKIVATNNWKKEKICQEFGISDSKVLAEPNAVDVESFSLLVSSNEAREKLLLPKEKCILTYVGQLKTMGMEKGIGALFEMMKKLDDKFTLLIVGGSDSDIAFYKFLAQKEGIREKIIFTGFVPHAEIPLYLCASDILLAPFPRTDHYEFYMSPMKIFEYMASGKPVIASDLLSIREIAGESVEFIFPGDADAFVEKVQLLEADSMLREEFGRKGREMVQKYTWEKRAERLLTFLSQ